MFYIYLEFQGKKHFVASVPFEPTSNFILSIIYEYLIFNQLVLDFDKDEVMISIEKKGRKNYYSFKTLLEYTK